MSSPSGTAVTHVGYCPTTHKRCYVTKRDARIIRRRMGVPGLSVFRCTSCPYWHLGHHGDLSHEEHRARRSA